MVEALLVDVDGVLVRGRPADGKPWASGLEADLGLRPADLHAAFFARHWEEIVLGRAGLIDRLSEALREIAPHLTAEGLIAYWFEQDSRLDRALLDELAAERAAGREIHLATNQEHLRADFLMRTLGLAPHVDGMHYSAALGCRKPDPAFFLAVAGRLGRPPGELLLIDDTPENLEGARAAGCRAVPWTGETSLAALLRPLGIGAGHP